MAVTKLMIEPLLSFITKVAAVKTGGAGDPVALRTQAFAAASKVAAILEKVRPEHAASGRNEKGCPNTYQLRTLQQRSLSTGCVLVEKGGRALQQRRVCPSGCERASGGWLQMDAAIREELPPVVAKMKLYLQNVSTRAILFKPIK